MHRQVALKALNVICLCYETRKKDIESYREMWAKELWLVLKLWDHVPKAVLAKIVMDQEINETDPDFSFYRAVFGQDPTPIPELKPQAS